MTSADVDDGPVVLDLRGRTMKRRKARPAVGRPRASGDATSGEASVSTFLTRVLVRLYVEFDGDVLQALVLGELGVGTVQPNACAIAQATGIPRETVRRKLAALERRRWIRRDHHGTHVITIAARRHFAPWMVELRAQVLDLASRLRDDASFGTARFGQ